MSGIPWSAEAEYRLRRRISLLRIGIVLCAPVMVLVALFGLKIHPLLWAGFADFGAAAWMAVSLGNALLELGYEERVWSGQRIPGSGMLANKPRDTSRLTKWRRCDADIPDPKTGKRVEVWNFMCNCGRIHFTAEMKWVPNVMEYEEECDAPAVVSAPWMNSRTGSILGPGAGDAAAPGPASPAGRAEDVRASDRSQPESSPSAIDPGGGRWVLICECGMGHYMLRGDRPTKEGK